MDRLFLVITRHGCVTTNDARTLNLKWVRYFHQPDNTTIEAIDRNILRGSYRAATELGDGICVYR